MRVSAAIPRLRFGLRSVLLLTTLICAGFAWCGKQAMIARERQAVRAWLNRQESWTMCTSPSLNYIQRCQRELTWLRRAMGDRLLIGYHFIEEATPEEIERCAAAFPEAQFHKTAIGVGPTGDDCE